MSDKLPYSSSRETGVPVALVRQLIVLSLVAGLVGGAGGGWWMMRYSKVGVGVTKQSIQVLENSAVIDVVKKVSPSVVSITSKTTGYSFFGTAQSQEGAGTGIILTADGLIMTNKHVVEGDTASYSVFTSDGHEYKGAKVVARDSVNDIAFLRITASGLVPAELGDSAAAKVGQRVVAIGNALGQFQNSVTEGIISGLGRPITAGDGQGNSEPLQNLFQTDAAINPGNSGGPLVNLEGQVIGMNTAVAGNAQNIGFAIPINETKSLIDSVKTKGKISRPYLGVRYIPITKDFASRNNLKITDGAYVYGDQQNLAVVPDSPAAKAGFVSGDIITKIGDKTIDASNSLTALVGAHKVGDKISITYIRGSETKTVEVSLEEAPAA